MGPLKEPWSSEVGDPRSSEARSDECLEDWGLQELNVSYFTTSGGSWEGQIPGSYEAFGFSEVTNVSRIVALGGSIYRILHVSEAQGSPDSYGLKRGCDCGWVRLKNLARARLRGLETPEAGSDECLEDRVPGRLHLSYSTCLGGSRSSRF